MAFNVEDQSEDSLKCFPTLPCLQYVASEDRPCWFVSVIRCFHQYMKVVIPAKFGPFIFAPSEMMVTVNDGKCSYIVEVENQQLTKGWYNVALNHKLGKNYTMLFASVRCHVFELFIFDEEGSQVKHELINNGLDSQVHGSIAAIMNVDERPFVTSYLPAPFQASSSEHQFCRTVRKADLKEMELPNMFKAIANVNGLQQVTLITKARTWKASKVDAVNQAPTGSAQPANLVTSGPLVEPQRTIESAWAVHQPKSTERNEAGMRRPFVTRGKSKVKALPKLQRKIRMALDGNNSSGRSTHQQKLEARKRGLWRHFEAKLNIKEESAPELKKENMDLDDNRSSGKVKKGKTKEDTKYGRPYPHPGRKVHVVSLDVDAIEEAEINLAYHKKFLENVFGSRASEITIAHSYPNFHRFGAWLTDEEVDMLSGQDLVFRVKCTHDREITLEGSN